jgi:thymidylate kinase
MRTIIFEGIATSGKTSIEKYLIEILNAQKVKYFFVGEDKTLMPLLYDNNEQKTVALLKENLRLAFAQKREVYIFDRLHITHVLRTKVGMEKFEEIEKELVSHNPILILLKINEDKIPERVLWAMENREPDWVRHARVYGDNQQIFQHYIDQQRELDAVINATTLPHRVIETSRMNFKEIAEDIYKTYCL